MRPLRQRPGPVGPGHRPDALRCRPRPVPTPGHPAADLPPDAEQRRGTRSSSSDDLYNGVNLNVSPFPLLANSTRRFFQIRLNQRHFNTSAQEVMPVAASRSTICTASSCRMSRNGKRATRFTSTLWATSSSASGSARRSWRPWTRKSPESRPAAFQLESKGAPRTALVPGERRRTSTSRPGARKALGSDPPVR